MKVRDLIRELESFDEDAEVRLMTQDSYPFQNSVSGVTDGGSILAGMDERDLGDEEPKLTDFDGDVAPNTVYITEGRQLGYGYKNAWGY